MPKPRAGIKSGGPAARAAAAAGGATGSSKKAAKKSKDKKAAAKRGGGSGASAAELIERAQQALAYDDYDGALEMLREACKQEPGSLEALDAYGSLLAETGQSEEAAQVLRRAVELSPDEGFEKYMYLGQLLEGEEGLAAARRGVEVLSSQAERERGGGRAELKQQLCAALCSLAEMVLAATGDPESVAEEVDSLLQRARDADASSPEPLQALASLRYEQGRQDEALALLRQSMALWFKPDASDDGGSDDGDGDDGETSDGEMADADEAAAGGSRKKGGGGGGGGDGAFVKPRTMSEDPGEDAAGGSGNDEDGSGEWVDADEEDELPSFEFRFECAKLLLELDESTDAAIQVLEGLLAENDSVPDVWHLLGLAYYSGGALEEAEEVANHGAALLAKQRAGAGRGGGGGGGGGADADEVAAAFDDLKSAIAEAKGGGDGDAGGAQ